MASTRIDFPKPLKDLLEGSDLEAPIGDLANRVGKMLAANQMPFFPDYTDHGIEHVNRVLETEVELIPDEVFERSKKHSRPRLPCDADAAVIMGEQRACGWKPEKLPGRQPGPGETQGFHFAWRSPIVQPP
jgi:hypothetical protein